MVNYNPPMGWPPTERLRTVVPETHNTTVRLQSVNRIGLAENRISNSWGNTCPVRSQPDRVLTYPRCQHRGRLLSLAGPRWGPLYAPDR